MRSISTMKKSWVVPHAQELPDSDVEKAINDEVESVLLHNTADVCVTVTYSWALGCQWV